MGRGGTACRPLENYDSSFNGARSRFLRGSRVP